MVDQTSTLPWVTFITNYALKSPLPKAEDDIKPRYHLNSAWLSMPSWSRYRANPSQPTVTSVRRSGVYSVGSSSRLSPAGGSLMLKNRLTLLRHYVIYEYTMSAMSASS